MDNQLSQNRPTPQGGVDLDAALAAWKTSRKPAETLSDVARSRILARAAAGESRLGALREVFFPLRRLALAGVLPVVLLAALTGLLGYVAHDGMGGAPGRLPPISATKTSDGEVIFRIANGGRTHKVYLSTAPNSFEAAPAFTTLDGAFRDRLDGGPDLVFYRID